jgi:hypothetical protein
MIEAALMGGLLPGPWSTWELVGATTELADGRGNVSANFPPGIKPDDLVVAIMSPRSETTSTTMVSSGWQHWSQSGQDYVCTARFNADLVAPTYVRAGTNPIFVSVLAFRAKGWSTVKLEAHTSPAIPLNITTKRQNELLLAIGLTPQTTRPWVASMVGAVATSRIDRANAPAMKVATANVDFPQEVTGITVDAPSGSERNLIFTVS